jgi:hypothetical protein
VLAVAHFTPSASVDRAAQRAYEASILLTDLDRLNKSKGYALYLPDSYAKCKLYWELAYGVMLPDATDGEPVAFAKIAFKTGGEQIVPLQALVR